MRGAKYLVMIAASLALTTGRASGEDEKGLYFNAMMEPVKNKKSAVYYGELVEKTDDGYHYQVFYMSGEVKMDGWYQDEAMTQPEGQFTYYYRSGQIESQGTYYEGVKFGLWERYTRAGDELPEKLYASNQMMKAIARKEK